MAVTCWQDRGQETSLLSPRWARGMPVCSANTWEPKGPAWGQAAAYGVFQGPSGARQLREGKSRAKPEPQADWGPGPEFKFTQRIKDRVTEGPRTGFNALVSMGSPWQWETTGEQQFTGLPTGPPGDMCRCLGS